MCKSSKQIVRHLTGLGAVLMVFAFTGCTSALAPINGIPASRLPRSFLAAPRSNQIPMELSRLTMEAPDEYLLGAGDILGVYVEGVLPPAGADEAIATPPPVNFPERGSDLPPSIGYPIPVRDDGKLSLPLLEPFNVRGLTLGEVEDLVRRSYTTDKQILQPGQDRIVVTLMRERTIRVIVVREDGDEKEDGFKLKNGQLVTDSGRQSMGHVLDLPAYKNDLMHALAETGGLPGLNAKNEVKIMRRDRLKSADRSAFIKAFYAQYANDRCSTPPPLPEDPSAIRIPLRYSASEIPEFTDEDIILHDGDIVYIEARETEFFFTGGLLPGGQFPIPRDYDLNVLGAMSLAGRGPSGNTQIGNSAGATILGGGFGGATPTLLYVFRKLPNGREITIEVDLVEAMNDPSQRLLVQPGDTLLLRYKPCEELLNFSLIGLFTFGIRELFN